MVWQPKIMESSFRFVWMIAKDTGYVIKEKEHNNFPPIEVGEYKDNWATENFKESKNPKIETELIKLIFQGKIKR